MSILDDANPWRPMLQRQLLAVLEQSLVTVSGSIVVMRCLVVVLYVVAVVMQLGGAAFVIHDIVRSTATMCRFRAGWKRLDETPGMDWPEFKQQALAELATADTLSGWRRWGPVVVLLLGVIVSFVANVMALYIPVTPTWTPV